jgi:uncharacterized protein YbjT (DUF2867 family)
MRILITGASGMIGSALADRLLAAGHGVVLGVRNVESARGRWPGAEVLEIDYAAMGEPARWVEKLAGIDAIVNAVGIFREQDRQTFDALHVKGPRVLFEAAVAAGVGRIIQLSALGARPDAATAFLATKGRADAALQQLPVAHAIVMPSLVFAPAGRSTRWFTLLASLPVVPLPGGGVQPVQPVHLDDLCDAVARLVEVARPPARLEAVGATRVSLQDYIRSLKRALGFGGCFVPVPMRLVKTVLRWPFFRGGAVTSDAMAMLESGSTGDSAPLSSLIGRAPTPVDAFVPPSQRAALRRDAAMGWLLPLLRYCMAALWIATGLISVFAFPVADSLELLARTGLHGAFGMAALYGAAALDVLLGVLALFASTRRASYLAQLGLVAFYTVVISAFLPEYWRHPYGPVLKNIPLLAAIALLYYLDRPDGILRR